MARKQMTLAAALLAASFVGADHSAEAGDLLGTLGLGHCSTCQQNYATVPAYVPVPAYYYPARAYGPRMAVVRQMPGRPPEPAPKWARPRGSVPVIALPEPAPKWADVDPSALAVNARPLQYPTQIAQPYPTMVQSFANGQRVIQTPVGPRYVPIQQVQPVGVQPLPNATVAQPGAVMAQPGAVIGQPGAVAVQPGFVGQPAPYGPGTVMAQPGAVAPGTTTVNIPALPAGTAGTVVGTPRGAQVVAGPQPMVPGYGVPAPATAQAVAPYGAGGHYAGAAPVVAHTAPHRPVATMPRTSRVQAFSDDTSKPPPGTLGRTYMRPTRMVPWDTHPRVGMLDVEILDTMRMGLARDVKIKVTAQDMYGNFKPLEGYRGDDDVWHFESDPLLPTVPHIYNVRFELIREVTIEEVRYGRRFQRVIEKNLGTLGVRRVRLIPGRIVDLIFY